MTHHTDTDRAELLQDAQAAGFGRIVDGVAGLPPAWWGQDISALEAFDKLRAARRAPAVPVLHDAEKLRQVNFMLDRLLECADAVKEDYARAKQMMGRGLEKHCVQSAMEISHSIKQRMEDVKRLLAAAPQPPETSQLDDTNVVDMPQAVDLKEVAPVQMPEPRIYWIEATTQFCIKRGGEVPFASAWEPLYTEQQVLAILSKHGIKTK